MSRRQKRLRNLAIVNILLVIAAIAGVAYLIYALQPAPYDEETLCEIGANPPRTAVILDKTDAYDDRQAKRIASLVRRTQDDLEIGERFTLYELDANARFDPAGEFSLCNPGRGAQVNPMFGNPKIVEERYKALFEGPLDEALADLVTPKVAPSSPILEAVAGLAQTDLFSPSAPKRRVILVSDMLQNSPVFTVYGGRGKMPANIPDALDAADMVRDRYGDDLRGVSLEVRLIPRPGFEDIQRGDLRDYWTTLFDDLGVEVKFRDL